MKISDLFKVEGYGVVVTGGASGIGLGYAEVFASNGARVTILDMDAQRIEKETKRLRGAGLDVRGQVVDVTDHQALDAAIDEAANLYGRLDVMFANAGIDPGVGFVGDWAGSERPRVPEGALENYTDERWNRVIEVNMNGIFATVRAAVRHMKPRKFGRIIITTSLAATRIEPAIGAAYMTAKAGIRNFMRNAAMELAAYDITVNAIAPGYIVTNIGGGHALNPVEQKAVAGTIPMHRVGFPEDMHGLAIFLASPSSSYITGQEIIVDGGQGIGVAD
ncbi:MAG: SDR family oxidoreductase [Acidobacteria bacterium]|nr:SDR family oxidoreductase [Acidobacteriota bacterium]